MYEPPTADRLCLYYSPGACSFVARIALEEIGHPYDLVKVSSRSGDTQSAAWHALNPKGRIPALTPVPGTMGGTPRLLTELPAILFYLASLHPEIGLWPTDLAGQARCIEWMNWLSGTVHERCFAQTWRSERFTDEAAAESGIQAKGHENLRDSFAYIERIVGDGREWVVLGGYTVVDPYVLLFHLWGRRIGHDTSGLYPNWTALCHRIAARPAVKRIMDLERPEAHWMTL